jgi:hypothetical protein
MVIPETLPDVQRSASHGFGLITLARVPVNLSHNGEDLSPKRWFVLSQGCQDVL